ncbi:hypothetical protein D3C80_1176580 [compost metagenome]
MHVFRRTEQERQAENGGFLDEIVEGGGVDAVHVDDAEAGLLDGILLTAENRIVHDLHLDAAIGAFRQKFAHIFHGFNRRITVGMNIGRAQGDFLRLDGNA